MISDQFLLESIMYLINIVFLGQICGYFFIQFRKGERERLTLYLFYCFFGFFLASFFYFVHIFLVDNFWFWKIGVSCRFFGLITFVHLFEVRFLQRKPVYSYIFLACIATIILTPENISYYFGLTIYAAAAVLLFHFFYVRSLSSGSVRLRVTYGIIGGIIWGAGVGLQSDFLYEIWSGFFSLGLVLQLGGLATLGISFQSIKSFDEFLWHDFPRTLFVLYSSMSAFTWSFESDQRTKEEDLLSGGLASVLIVVQTILESDRPMDVIDNRENVFLVNQGDHCIAVLIAKKDLLILREKLDGFVKSFEDKFRPFLENWTGDVKPFEEGGVEIVDQVFRDKSFRRFQPRKT